MANKTEEQQIKLEVTDTFRGTLGVRVSSGDEVLWAGFVFPALNPKNGKQEWAVDAYVGTMEPEYFISELEVRGNKKLSEVVYKNLKEYLGSPTFDVAELREKLETKTVTA